MCSVERKGGGCTHSAQINYPHSTGEHSFFRVFVPLCAVPERFFSNVIFFLILVISADVDLKS